jgi:cytochrome b561
LENGDMIRNTQDAWGWPAVVLHWVIALLVIGLFGFGLWMKEVPARPDRPFYYAIHASIGITVLALMVVRFVWWLRNATPVLPEGTPDWQSRVSKISHRLLYTLTFATLVIGWLLSGTMRQPLEPMLFGLIPIPQILEGRTFHSPLGFAHEYLAYALIALVVVHAGAALYHHFIQRDDVLRRMLAPAPTPINSPTASQDA